MKNMKGFYGLLLALVWFPVYAFAQQFSNEGMVYKVLSVEDQTVILHKAHRCVQDFRVPYDVMDYSETTYRVSEIEYDAFRNLDCLYELNLNGVEVIRDGYARRYEDGAMDYFGAFANCRNLKGVTFGALKDLGDYAFYGCNLLTGVSLENVEMVGKGAFLNCKNLEQVSLGAKVGLVLDDAFVGSQKLKKVEVKAMVPPTCAEHAFAQETYEQVVLNVPEGSASAYQQATGWKNFAKIVEVPVSGISTVEVRTVQVRCQDGEVVVEAVPQGKMVRVYDDLGRRVGAQISQGAPLRFTLKQGKVYWVKVENQRAVGVKC